MNETLPGEVYLIGAANAFVANRGGILGFGSRRVMALGLPLLAALTVSEMRAVLAHEFGHYYGGDTRLIPWVYKAQKAIVRALENVGSIQDGFQNGILQVLFTLVFGILKGTFGVFLRVVNFISRKQEFRADELACIVAGASSHEQGLRKVHSATMAWPSYWQTEVVPVLGRGCAPEIGDGFCRYLKAPLIAGQVSQLLEKELSEGKTAPFDSHPRLRERLNAIDQLQMDTRPQDTRAASTLLDTAQTAEEQFLRFLNPEFPEAGLRVVTWDNVGQEVMIPAWKSTVSQYAMIFSDVTPELLPDLMPKLGQLAAKVRDPVGRILTGQERLQTVATILGIGVQLALLANGWELVNLPGVFYLKRGEETIVPENEVIAVLSGKTSRDAWVARCAELGITHVALASLGERPAA